MCNNVTMDKLLTFFVIIILMFCSLLIYADQTKPELNFDGLTISPANYNVITEPLPEGKFVLCSMKDNKCNLMFKGGLD